MMESSRRSLRIGLGVVLSLLMIPCLRTAHGFGPARNANARYHHHHHRAGHCFVIKSKRILHTFQVNRNNAKQQSRQILSALSSSSSSSGSEQAGDGTDLSKHMERAWRYAKKPLLSIGSKGATLTHGNSLRQLLDQHTVVKVKVNTRRFDDSLHQAFAELRALAEENGAPTGIEMLQARDSEKIILFGLPGTLQRIRDNTFPPAEEET